MSKPSTSTLRIIGGQWKRRNVRFLAVDDLRPTPDRVRETVFNWLQFDIQGKRCLDAFAGSGALGLEALSRGAAGCLFLEKSGVQAKQLQATLKELGATNGDVWTGDSLTLLSRITEPFDLVFLDPPYALNLWQPVMALLAERQLLAMDCLVYVEADKPWEELSIPAGWEYFKETKAGSVKGYLARRV
ncbi:16S rRNA (guanine966-N2)-methyltransferase [Fluviicoccus keumensis]|uniref:Ribosomal RNA small subunit methyltransferase D n=1 Tax=Fluviicoccus keumensis TaxID=1435465 RepID=A0A4Q7Z8U4_9GAMM|nr:16S rRNA (guanine(966)-N(2))-methyltransferase RsmD [Fluviicoccus keumensis]RZU46932.1 16S rRNA (guanine966-N2)-methyltransferase [Fluviicoccus keumensis]